MTENMIIGDADEMEVPEIMPAELPCPRCWDSESVGRYTRADWYHCYKCNAKMSYVEYRNLKDSR